jgi:hypothetical protein
MKSKVSVTIESTLVAFVDRERGATRSEKIESILRRYREVQQELDLRRELAAFNDTQDDRADTEAWHRVMQEAMWKESGAGISGPSRSRRSRNRGRR